MSDDAWQPFAELIEKGDVEGVVAAVDSLDEPARKRLSVRARRAVKQQETPPVSRPALAAAQAMQFGTGGARAAARQWFMLGDGPDLRERLVRSRPRAWRQEWAEQVCADRDGLAWGLWDIVHGMVKDATIDHPEAEAYVTGAVDSLPERSSHDGRPPRPLADVLLTERAWLHEDLWALFRIEETGLTTHDSMWGAKPIWQAALVALAADGVLPRARLLDESLAALRRDFAAHHARWYHKFFLALEPTTDELEARLDDLLALLAAEDSALVAFALRLLGSLERAHRLPADRYLEAVGPALTLSAKGHVTRAVKLAGRLVRVDPQQASVALPVLLAALGHEAREVQEAVLDVVERQPDALTDADRRALGELAPVLDPALRGRAAALGGGGPSERPAAAKTSIPPRRPHDFGAPRLRGDDALTPITTIDELLDRAAMALERGDDPDEVELVIDAISRLRDSPVDPGRATALVERAASFAWAWEGVYDLQHARQGVALVLLRWLRPEIDAKLKLKAPGRSPLEAIVRRLRELLADLASPHPRALLAVPTHRGGWVAAGEAVRRVASPAGDRPLAMDLAQLVLRIAPDDRQDALERARRLKGEAAGVLVVALGGERRRPRRSHVAIAWDAAARARDPAAYAPPAPDFNDISPMRGAHLARRKPKLDGLDPVALAELEQAWWGWEPNGLERWLTRVWPARRDAAFTVVSRRLWGSTGERLYGVGDVIELLLDPGEPITPSAELAIALGLGAADAIDRALAADVALAALGDRRLDGAALGAVLARVLRTQAVSAGSGWPGVEVSPELPVARAVPSRWATALGDIAGAGALHAREVQTTVEAVLAAATAADQRRLLVLVELLRRLAVDSGAPVADPRARSWLEALAPGSKTGRAAREALSVPAASE